MIINNKKVQSALNWAGKCLHAPEQRLILGATALATQPFIDLNNKAVDEDTRKISAARTVAKIIAGTLVGVAVRYAGIKFVQAFSKHKFVYSVDSPKMVQKIIPDPKRGFLTPTKFKGAEFPLPEQEVKKRIEKYQKAMGTLAATVVMVATNFLLDAPLTKYFTRIFQCEFLGAPANSLVTSPANSTIKAHVKMQTGMPGTEVTK